MFVVMVGWARVHRGARGEGPGGRGRAGHHDGGLHGEECVGHTDTRGRSVRARARLRALSVTECACGRRRGRRRRRTRGPGVLSFSTTPCVRVRCCCAGRRVNAAMQYS